jgi:signal transduction histidine kinase
MSKADSDKTKEQLLNELGELRRRIAAFETSETEHLSAARLPNGQEQAGKEMQEHMVRSQELAVVGKLARGVGHELRNPLGAMKNAAYFLNMALEEHQQEVKDALEILNKNVAKCETIIKSLHVFANPKPPALRKMNIKDVIQKALLHTSIPENIKVVRELNRSLPILLSDSEQLFQAFGNIILNAIQSMPEGGELTITAEEWHSNDAIRSPKSEIRIHISDTGMGIPRENLGKVFQPLFTTKAKGIGLGLALAKSMVEGHGGNIEVRSEVGKGSTFTVRLPTGLTIED